MNHACPTRVQTTTVTTSKAVYTREGLEEVCLHWGAQAGLHSCFAGLDEELDLLKLETRRLLNFDESRRLLAAWGWDTLLPRGWQHLELPQTVVAAESSEEWALASAIGTVLSKSKGRSELERQNIPLTEKSLIQFIEKATESGELYRCTRSDCYWMRPFKPASHDCVSALGEFFRPEYEKRRKTDAPTQESTKRNRHCQSMVCQSTIHRSLPPLRSYT